MISLTITQHGNRFWYLNNKWHRANGPAIAYYDGEKSWYWYGNRVGEYEHMMLSGQEITDG